MVSRGGEGASAHLGTEVRACVLSQVRFCDPAWLLCGVAKSWARLKQLSRVEPNLRDVLSHSLGFLLLVFQVPP